MTDIAQNENFNVETTLNIHSNLVETEEHMVNNKNNDILKFGRLQVNMSSCELTDIPGVIFSYKYLTVLNLSNNFLEVLPKEIGNLCNLLTLKLSQNKLKCLPKSLKNVQQLSYLDLSCNNFTEVPEILYYSLRTLTILNLSCNEINKFNDPPACVNKLIALDVSVNFFKEIPIWVFDNLCQLQFLDISQNQFCTDSKFLNYSKTGIYESLQMLNIKNCNLSSKNLENLNIFKKLKVLYLGNENVTNKISKGRNYLGNLDSNVFINFQEITNLHLQSVQIATLPTGFAYLKNIEKLDLSSNLLSWLPESFCELINLKILYLTSNQLLFLPGNIGKLINLKQIHLGNNKLCQVPDSFYNLTSLEYIDLYNNEIERIEWKIFMEKNLKGIDLGLNYLLFDFCESNVDTDEFMKLYVHLRDTFRNNFCYTNSRCDIQMTKVNKSVSETGSDCHSYSNKYSVSSFESEPLSDIEDAIQNLMQQNYSEDDNWDLHDDEEDEKFDPNETNLFLQPQNNWESDFQNNYCPANYHAPSVMKTYIRNFKLALKNENVEEGQFDSD